MSRGGRRARSKTSKIWLSYKAIKPATVKNFILCLIIASSMMTTDAESQIQLSGSTYKASVEYVCKKMPGGGCTITTFCILSFSEETVSVHFYDKVSCVPEEREADYSDDPDDKKETYRWTKSGNVITIEGFDQYGTFEYHPNKLLTSKGTFDGSRIEFVDTKEEQET